MSRGVLVDTTLCIACRGCQVACKRENNLEAVDTEFNVMGNGMQNAPALNGETFTLITYTELEQDNKLKWAFAKHQCMHCVDPACAAACLVAALEKTDTGAVLYYEDKCIGCRYCQLVCPFYIPAFEWDKAMLPYIKKCTFCLDRQVAEETPAMLNDQPLTPEQKKVHAAGYRTPACVSTCPTGCLLYGDRDELLDIARRRIAANPKKYINHIYGEKEAGGTSWIYISDVPFEKMGLPANLGERSFPSYSRPAMKAVPVVIFGVGALLSGFYWFSQRRSQLEKGKGVKS